MTPTVPVNVDEVDELETVNVRLLIVVATPGVIVLFVLIEEPAVDVELMTQYSAAAGMAADRRCYRLHVSGLTVSDWLLLSWVADATPWTEIPVKVPGVTPVVAMLSVSDPPLDVTEPVTSRSTENVQVAPLGQPFTVSATVSALPEASVVVTVMCAVAPTVTARGRPQGDREVVALLGAARAGEAPEHGVAVVPEVPRGHLDVDEVARVDRVGARGAAVGACCAGADRARAGHGSRR